MDGKLVRDPIHNYINITPLEQPIIDGRLFQRLRFIYQNSTAYLTYPSNTNTRFLHSMGAMHLCGQMFTKALESSTSKTLETFIEAADLLIGKLTKTIMGNREELVSFWEEKLGNASHFAHHPLHGNRISADSAVDANKLFIINTLWQAIRIAALCHDLGHFPMSHLFEKVNEAHNENNSQAENEAKARKSSYIKFLSEELQAEANRMSHIPLHELRGLILFDELLESNESDYSKLVNSIARNILSYDPYYIHDSNDETDIYRCLHRLTAGELDADRLDYCMRDPQQSGFEHNVIDIQRILNNFVLIVKQGRYIMVPTDKALSAIEAFYHHRFCVYKYVIYHHNVTRFNCILESILLTLLDISGETSAEYRDILNIIDRYHFVHKEQANIDRQQRFLPDDYAHLYEDAWLRTMLTEVYTHLCESSLPDDNSHVLVTLKKLLQIFLYRQTDDIYSAWKRDTDFHDTYKKISDILNIEYSVILKANPFGGQDDGTRNARDACIRRLRKELDKHDVVLVMNWLNPKIFTTNTVKELDVLCKAGLCTVAKASPYIASLKSVVDRTPDLHISFVYENIKKNTFLIDKCDELLHKHLAMCVKTIFSESDIPYFVYSLSENNRRKVDERRVNQIDGYHLPDTNRRKGDNRRNSCEAEVENVH